MWGEDFMLIFVWYVNIEGVNTLTVIVRFKFRIRIL